MVGSVVFGHCAAIDTEYSATTVPAHASVLSGFIVEFLQRLIRLPYTSKEATLATDLYKP
jgi:hypothetical protein